MVGFDSTTASVDALAYGIGWARRVGGRLDVLYVPGDGWQWAIDACAVLSPVGMATECLSDPSETVANLLHDAGLPWSYATGEGAVATALEHHADRTGADAIIIGRSRRHARTLRTSTAHQLLRCSDRIVIVVP